jgi:hypothetical protein
MDAEKHTFRAKLPQFLDLRQVSKKIGMIESVSPATQKKMTTCLETFEKKRVFQLPP